MKSVVAIGVLLFSCLAGAAEPLTFEAQLLRRLSARDGLPCAELFAERPAAQVQQVLLQIADDEHAVPWVAPRAARCLVEVRGEQLDVRAAMVEWASDHGRPGLMLIVAYSLPSLPTDSVEELLPLVQAQLAQQPRLKTLLTPALRSMMEPQRPE